LVKYNYQAGKTRALYESTNEPAGQLADNPPSSNGLWISIEPYPNCRFRSIDDLNLQFGNTLVPTGTLTGSKSPEPLLTVVRRLEHRYLIGAKVAGTVKWNCDPHSTWPKICSLSYAPGTNPTKTKQVGYLDGSETELNCFSGPHPDLLLTLGKGGYHSEEETKDMQCGRKLREKTVSGGEFGLRKALKERAHLKREPISPTSIQKLSK